MHVFFTVCRPMFISINYIHSIDIKFNELKNFSIFTYSNTQTIDGIQFFPSIYINFSIYIVDQVIPVISRALSKANITNDNWLIILSSIDMKWNAVTKAYGGISLTQFNIYMLSTGTFIINISWNIKIINGFWIKYLNV